MIMTRTFHVVLACTLDCGIGKNGTIPWHLPGDLAHFKELTKSTEHEGKQNMVIMGRKTWESLPRKPLSGRRNIVVTRNSIEGVECVPSLNEALRLADENIDSVFVIGGAQLYNEALRHPNCGTLYVTMINAEIECDTFFDSSIMRHFELVELGDVETCHGIEYAFAIFLPHVP